MEKLKNENEEKSDGVNIQKNDVDFGVELKTVLYARQIIRKEELIKYLVKKLKLSRRTVERRLRNELKTQTTITTIRADEFDRYGIDNKNKHAVYVTLKETKDLTRHLDDIFKLLKSKDANDIKLGVRKLWDYKFIASIYHTRYFLDRNQLNVLTDVLERSIEEADLNDDELREFLLLIILDTITSTHITPHNKQKFLETLRRLLDQYPSREFFNKPNSVIQNLIKILGIYRDQKVIDRLKEDLLNCSQQAPIAVGYGDDYTAKVIEDSKNDLLEFERRLQKENKREAMAFLDDVQRKAAENYQKLKRNNVRFYID
jgi:hypothetical protein